MKIKLTSSKMRFSANVLNNVTKFTAGFSKLDYAPLKGFCVKISSPLLLVYYYTYEMNKHYDS